MRYLTGYEFDQMGLEEAEAGLGSNGEDTDAYSYSDVGAEPKPVTWVGPPPKMVAPPKLPIRPSGASLREPMCRGAVGMYCKAWAAQRTAENKVLTLQAAKAPSAQIAPAGALNYKMLQQLNSARGYMEKVCAFKGVPVKIPSVSECAMYAAIPAVAPISVFATLPPVPPAPAPTPYTGTSPALMPTSSELTAQPPVTSAADWAALQQQAAQLGKKPLSAEEQLLRMGPSPYTVMQPFAAPVPSGARGVTYSLDKPRSLDPGGLPAASPEELVAAVGPVVLPPAQEAESWWDKLQRGAQKAKEEGQIIQGAIELYATWRYTAPVREWVQKQVVEFQGQVAQAISGISDNFGALSEVVGKMKVPLPPTQAELQKIGIDQNWVEAQDFGAGSTERFKVFKQATGAFDEMAKRISNIGQFVSALKGAEGLQVPGAKGVKKALIDYAIDKHLMPLWDAYAETVPAPGRPDGQRVIAARKFVDMYNAAIDDSVKMAIPYVLSKGTSPAYAKTMEQLRQEKIKAGQKETQRRIAEREASGSLFGMARHLG